MVFALNLFYSVICSYCFSRFYSLSDKYKKYLYFLFLAPLWIIWLFICGGQYKVGTDYETYYKIFKNGETSIFYVKMEYLFAWLVDFSHSLSLPPQTLFFIFYSIGFFFLIRILILLHHNTCFIFILLYISYSTVFNNQLNGLRQFIAIYICTYAIMQLNKKNGIKYFLLYTLFAFLIHSSSILILPFIFFKRATTLSYRWCYIILFLSILFACFGSYEWLLSHFNFLIPQHYQHYIGGTFDTSTGILKTITKLIFIPFYIYSIYIIKQSNINKYDTFLFKVGILGYCIRLIFLNNYILNRIGDLFLIISLLPLYFLLRDLYLKQKYGQFCLFCSFFILFYLTKVIIFPAQEYLYKSIYFYV